MPKVLSFINYKGGVGKTTSAYHVACSLVQHHRQKVLMIDIDPQTNLTFLCVTENQWERRRRNTGTIASMYERYQSRQPLEVGRFIWDQPVVVGRRPIMGLDLIPCDIELLGQDLGGSRVAGVYSGFQAFQEGAQQYLRDLSFLKSVIDATEDKYDWVIIDCPPNLYLMSQNAIFACDCYVVTAIPDHLSTIGLNILTRKVEDIISPARTFAGHGESRTVGELGAIVFVRVRLGGERVTNTHASNMDTISRRYEGKVVNKYTTELIGYSEAAENRVPVWEHNSDNARRVAQYYEYPTITRELLVKLT